jgi:hypothetical protein
MRMIDAAHRRTRGRSVAIRMIATVRHTCMSGMVAHPENGGA